MTDLDPAVVARMVALVKALPGYGTHPLNGEARGIAKLLPETDPDRAAFDLWLARTYPDRAHDIMDTRAGKSRGFVFDGGALFDAFKAGRGRDGG